jgi:hypothetical protein
LVVNACAFVDFRSWVLRYAHSSLGFEGCDVGQTTILNVESEKFLAEATLAVSGDAHSFCDSPNEV